MPKETTDSIEDFRNAFIIVVSIIFTFIFTKLVDPKRFPDNTTYTIEVILIFLVGVFFTIWFAKKLALLFDRIVFFLKKNRKKQNFNSDQMNLMSVTLVAITLGIFLYVFGGLSVLLDQDTFLYGAIVALAVAFVGISFTAARTTENFLIRKRYIFIAFMFLIGSILTIFNLFLKLLAPIATTNQLLSIVFSSFLFLGGMGLVIVSFGILLAVYNTLNHLRSIEPPTRRNKNIN